jgi:TonB-dependent starch-binding outer membrane protein SusC
MRVRLSRLVLCLTLLGLQTAAVAQQITGIVTGKDNSLLPGVNVVVKGSNRGATTNAEGRYSINAGGTATLVFSYIGYVTQEVAVNGRSAVNVQMAEDAQTLNEVVAIGYGTAKKSSLTGAVSSVTPKELTALPVISAAQAIQGRVPGVSVVNNSSPGATPIVRIRGVGSIGFDSSPLYVIDGVPAGGGINNFDPKDIESLEVLKDAAAAAIYGSRAANGVILVTTKKGKNNGKISVNIDSYYGSQSVVRRLDLLTRDEYIKYGTTFLTAANTALPSRWSTMNTPVYPGATQTFAQTETNWQDVMFQNAPIQDHQLSLSGGSERSNFYASVGHFGQEGIFPFTDYSRQSFRINSNHKVNKFLSIGQTLMVAADKRRAEREGGGRTMIMNMVRSLPYWPTRDPTLQGGFSSPQNGGPDATDPENPLRVAEMEQQNQVDRGVKILGTLFADINFTDYLRYRFTVGTDFSNSRFNQFLPIFEVAPGTRPRVNANVAENRNQFFSLVLTNQLTFDKTYGKHQINATAVAEQQTIESRQLNASGLRPDNTLQGLQGLVANSANTSSTLSENAIISYLGRINYEYAGKYLIGASIRRDGSSRFAPGNKWGTFPGLSVAWRISEEPFMKSIPTISELKLRGSYGQTGNNNVGGDYVWQAVVQANSTLYPIGGANQPGSFINGLGNLDLQWETTTMRNVGLDVGLLSNKFVFSTEVYKRDVDQLLLPYDLALSQGYSAAPTVNVGQMSNWGVEFAATYNKRGALNWSLTGMLDLVRNNVESLSTPNATINAGSNGDYGATTEITRTVAGQPIQSFYGWIVDGIFQNQAEIDAANALGSDVLPYQTANTRPGDIRFRDINGDGKVDPADRTFLGSYLPKFSYGLNWSGSWKNFDFTLFLQGVSGNKIYNGVKVIQQGMIRNFNAGKAVLNAWTPENPNTDVPRAISGDPNGNSRVSTRFLEDGSYMRIKNLSIGYTIPTAALSKLTNNTLSRVRVYVSSQNLLTFTNYTGYDPEIGSRNNGLLTNGVDYGQYPQARTLMVGLNLGF